MGTTRQELEKNLAVLDVFCDPWNIKIIAALRENERRFSDLQRTLGINSATFSSKLKKLEKIKVISKKQKSIDKLSVTYSLTPLGAKLLPIYDQITSFDSRQGK